MRDSFLVSILGILSACTDAGSGDPLVEDPPLVPGAPLPVATGVYAGGYRVPVTSELAGAASFAVDHVEWTVIGDALTLHYNLPVGLVGGRLDVTFVGTIAPGAQRVELTGAQGTGACVATSTAITCREEFENLGALPISMAVVEQTARLEYPGPVADRHQVAVVFGSDPIGFVEIDLTAPIIDDHGGDL